eukprot:4753838-Alexandrium_andersonii.AAC.1
MNLKGRRRPAGSGPAFGEPPKARRPIPIVRGPPPRKIDVGVGRGARPRPPRGAATPPSGGRQRPHAD